MKHNQEATLTVFGGKGIVQLVQTNLFKLTFRWEEFAIGSHPCFKFFFFVVWILYPFSCQKYKNFQNLLEATGLSVCRDLIVNHFLNNN